MTDLQDNMSSNDVESDSSLGMVLFIAALILVLIVFCVLPIAATIFLSPWLGVCIAFTDIVLWIQFGPPPMPGLNAGIIAFAGLLLSLCALVACFGIAIGWIVI